MSGTGRRTSKQRHAPRLEWWCEVWNGAAWEFDCIFTDKPEAFDHAQTKAERMHVRTRVLEVAGWVLWESKR